MNTNQQTVHQMGFGINEMVKQATGRESVSSIDMDWVSVEQLARYIYGSGSGDVVTFDTNIPDAIESLIAFITAVQDLHGYDNPWPAGGGTNKYDDEAAELTAGWSISNDGSVGQNAERSATLGYVSVKPSTEYTLAYTGDFENGIFFYNQNKTFLSFITWASNPRTFTTPANAGYMRLSFKSATVPTQVILNEGSVDTPTWEPYSNICPITGWTGCNVSRIGKNMANPADARPGNIINSTNGQVGENVSYTAYVGFIPVKPGEKYTLSGVNLHKREEGNSQAAYVNVVEYSGTHYSDYLRKLVNSQSSDNSYTFTIGSDAKYIRFCVGVGATDVQLETGTAATSYTEYQGETYEFTFPDEAGTVYGGTLDVLTGVLTVNMASVDLGTLDWLTYDGSGRHYVNKPANMKGVQNTVAFNGKCSTYIIVRGGGYQNIDMCIAMLNTTTLAINDSILNGLEPANFINAMTGVQLVYELETPVTYQLTAQEVEALVGQNNIYADTGNVSVQYKVKEDLV